MEILKELNNKLNQIFLNGSKAAILNQKFEKIKDKLRVLAENFQPLVS